VEKIQIMQCDLEMQKFPSFLNM